MPMQKQPDGTSRVKLEERVTDVATGKTETTRFGIDYKDAELGKVRIGETHRVAEGKQRGWWEPHTVVPLSYHAEPAPLEPFKRHNSAIEHLLARWDKARAAGWAPDGSAPAAASEPPGPAPAVEVQVEVSPSVAEDPTDGPAQDPEPATTGGQESPEPKPASSDAELPVMLGEPVKPAPLDAGSMVPASPLPPEALQDANQGAHETESIRIVPAGSPEDPDALLAQEQQAPSAQPEDGFPADELAGPVSDDERREWRGEVPAHDDWLSQPRAPFADGYPFRADDRNPVE